MGIAITERKDRKKEARGSAQRTTSCTSGPEDKRKKTQ